MNSSAPPHRFFFLFSKFDAQPGGEVIFATSVNSPLEIHGRLEKVGFHWGNPAVTTGVAIRPDESDQPVIQVAVNTTGTNTIQVGNHQCGVEVFVDGAKQGGIPYDDGIASISVSGRTISIEYANLLSVDMRMSYFGRCFFTVDFHLYNCETRADTVIGLLGSPDGDSTNDWMTPGNTVLDLPTGNVGKFFFEPAFNYTRDNWLITTENDSLFNYTPGSDGFATYSTPDEVYDPAIETAVNNVDQNVVNICGDDIACRLDGDQMGTEAAHEYQETPAAHREPAEDTTPPPPLIYINSGSDGDCPAGSGGNNTRYGVMKLCVRSSLGYTYNTRKLAAVFQEVNFIESLITIRYNLNAGFCVDSFNVEPKERLETTAIKDGYGLEAWLCDPLDTEDLTDPVRTLPKRITSYDPVSGTDAYNQGALITICVAPDDFSYEDNLVMSSLDSFDFYRDDIGISQPAIDDGAASDNFLTSFTPADCTAAEFCHFSSILFADFYVRAGEVYGTGEASMNFVGVERRLADEGWTHADGEDKGRRQLEELDTSSTFDLAMTVQGDDDGPGRLRTKAGGASYRLTLLATAVALFSAALLT
jgi:hypothetical protein